MIDCISCKKDCDVLETAYVYVETLIRGARKRTEGRSYGPFCRECHIEATERIMKEIQLVGDLWETEDD